MQLIVTLENPCFLYKINERVHQFEHYIQQNEIRLHEIQHWWAHLDNGDATTNIKLLSSYNVPATRHMIYAKIRHKLT